MIIKKIYKSFDKCLDNTLETLVFDLGSIISNENIINHKNVDTNIPDTSVYFETGGQFFDIPTNIEFDLIFSREDPSAYQTISSTLKWVSFNSEIETDILPAGYRGICLIDFPLGKPEEMFQGLAEFGEIKVGKDFDMLFLTSQAMMDKILENM